MKKLPSLIFAIFFALITLISGIVALCTAKKLYLTDGFAPFSVTATPAQTKQVYVDGAVEFPGFYEVSEDDTIGEVVALASPYPNYYLDVDENKQFNFSLDVLILPYSVGMQVFYPINVNTSFSVVALARGIPQRIISQIEEYKRINGYFTNKEQLKTLLGSQYVDYCFMFYIGEEVAI